MVAFLPVCDDSCKHGFARSCISLCVNLLRLRGGKKGGFRSAALSEIPDFLMTLSLAGYTLFSDQLAVSGEQSAGSPDQVIHARDLIQDGFSFEMAEQRPTSPCCKASSGGKTAQSPFQQGLGLPKSVFKSSYFAAIGNSV